MNPPSATVPKRDRVSCDRDVLALCDYAIDRLKAAGFVRVAVSLRSEATYWRLPGRRGTLRVAAHPRNGRSLPGLSEVVARITFRGGKGARSALVCTDEYVENMITWAVGQYVLRSTMEGP